VYGASLNDGHYGADPVMAALAPALVPQAPPPLWAEEGGGGAATGARTPDSGGWSSGRGGGGTPASSSGEGWGGVGGAAWGAAYAGAVDASVSGSDLDSHLPPLRRGGGGGCGGSSSTSDSGDSAGAAGGLPGGAVLTDALLGNVLVVPCPTTRRRVVLEPGLRPGGSVLPYVYTVPEPLTVVGPADGVYVLCDPQMALDWH